MNYKEQKKEKRIFPSWAKGQNDKGKQRYHPYLELDFKFDTQLKQK